MTYQSRRYAPSIAQVLWVLRKLQQASGIALVALLMVGGIMSMLGYSLHVEDKPLIAGLGAALGLILPVPAVSSDGR